MCPHPSPLKCIHLSLLSWVWAHTLFNTFMLFILENKGITVQRTQTNRVFLWDFGRHKCLPILFAHTTVQWSNGIFFQWMKIIAKKFFIVYPTWVAVSPFTCQVLYWIAYSFTRSVLAQQTYDKVAIFHFPVAYFLSALPTIGSGLQFLKLGLNRSLLRTY